MRIAILLRGICYKEKHVSNGTNGIEHKVDFRISIPSIQENIIDPLKSRGHNVDIYCVTYMSILPGTVNILQNVYEPKKILLLSWEGSTQRKTFIEGLTMINEHDYDAVISLRFDLLICSNILKWNIDYSKINFLWHETEYMKPQNALGVCDVIHIIPCIFFKKFMSSLKEDINYPNMHFIDSYLYKEIGEENVHFLHPYICNSNTIVMKNPFYEIVRVKL